ncbi:MAG: class I SAM-dependent methyltransferase [Leadbetterella sp.]|jgi:ubiquinone/menaquinone biosynthesis C-methylase UbiE|nr:class I SAM-dependent methyltransferase [Leadbetterella sp.]
MLKKPNISNRMINKYIPALRFHWLTNIYDWLVSGLMPEKELKNEIIKNANIQDNYTVLDFGIGTATLSIMAYKSNPKAIFKGLDIDDNILKIAKQKIKNSNVKIELIKYNGGTLPFSDNTIDRIITSLVLHHLTTEQKLEAFFEFKRVLNSDGELHIADWGKASNYLMRLMFNVVQLLDGYKTTNDNVKGKLPSIIKQAGFKQVNISQKINTVLGTVEIFQVK